MTSVVRHGLSMRPLYKSPPIPLGGWFPKHMFKGLKQMQAKLHSIDGIIEVHDARIPFTGRNPKLSDIGIVKPSILVFNKVDLISEESAEIIRKKFEESQADVVFTNCKNTSGKSIRNLVPTMLEKLQRSERYNRAERMGMNLMVVGIPNVGKSSLINALRHCNMHRSRAAEVAPRPGVTKHVMEKIQVWWTPKVYVRDTPGVLEPRVSGPEAAMRLAIVDAIDQRLVGREGVADYLLYWLNSKGRHEYATALQLPGPTDDLQQLLLNIAVRSRLVYHRRNQAYPDLSAAASHFIDQWRSGAFGCAMIDL